jgi:hypothetical protein
MFGFGKKKQQSLPELPPPPSPPEFPMPEGDIPSIKPPSELPEAPSFEPEEAPIELPEAPVPEMPEMPLPEFPSGEEEIAPPIEADTGHIEPIVPEEQPVEMPVEEVPQFEVPEKETVRRPVGPAFVSVDEYRNIMEHSNRVRSKLSEADEFVHRLSEIKADEEKTFDKWRAQLEEIERKLGQIDRVIAKAKR